MLKLKLGFILLLLMKLTYASQIIDWPLQQANINTQDTASLQRGARNFMNYCAGCHSLRDITYEQMAERIQLWNSDQEIYTDLLKDNLIFTGASITDPINTAMTMKQATAWLGAMPPDLSLIAKIRGANWLYTYLNSFYPDAARPWGSNNLLLKNTAMPNVLLNLQGAQEIIYQQDGSHTISHLVNSSTGTMNPEQFQQFTRDIVNFLVVVGTPPRHHKVELGFWLELSLAFGLLIVYLIAKLSLITAREFKG